MKEENIVLFLGGIATALFFVGIYIAFQPSPHLVFKCINGTTYVKRDNILINFKENCIIDKK